MSLGRSIAHAYSHIAPPVRLNLQLSHPSISICNAKDTKQLMRIANPDTQDI